MHNTKRVGIVGGGPGGLTLARILGRRGIACTVFELDEHPGARPQGGSLDIHAESGQRALREAGLLDRFRALARYDDQSDVIYDHHGTLHFEHTGAADGERPEIDRTQLRAILLESVPRETIRWGTKVRAVQAVDGGRVRVDLERGAPEDFDLVVGADGAWSKVRPLLSPETPRYTGVTFLELRFDDIDARRPALAALVPRGKIAAVGQGKGFIAQRSSGSHVRAYFMFRVPEDWVRAIDLSSPARARAALKKELAGWAPSLLAFVDGCEDEIAVRPIVALPVGHRWPHRPGVTLLGDAAHVMPPFSGEGVNMAMLDATELALRLAEDDDWSRAVAAYEAEMFVRAAEAAAGAMEGMSFVSEDALTHLIAHFRSMESAASGAGARQGQRRQPET